MLPERDSERNKHLHHHVGFAAIEGFEKHVPVCGVYAVGVCSGFWLEMRSFGRTPRTVHVGREIQRLNERETTTDLRRASLEQLAADKFDEYFEPFTGQALGAENQSWTAAVALDWIAAE